MKTTLQSAMKEAMKAKDKIAVDTIRSVLSAIQYEEIEKKLEPLPNDQILGVLQRELKKRKEEVEFAEKANRPDLLTNLQLEIKTLENFLPKQLSAAELEKILVGLKTNAGINMGLAMKTLKESHPGQYDGKLASEIAKRVFG